MKVQNKWIVSLGIAMLVGVIGSTELYGMKRLRETFENEQQSSFFEEFKSMPQDVQQAIQNLMLQDSIEFLGLMPFTIAGHEGFVQSLAVTGNKLLIASSDCTIRIYDLDTKRELSLIDVGDVGSIESIAVFDDKVVTGLHNGDVRIFNINTGQLLHRFAAGDNDGGFLGRNSILAVAAADNKVVTGEDLGGLKIWSLSGKLLHTLEGHGDNIFSVAINGDKVVSGSFDETVKIWDINSGQLLKTISIDRTRIFPSMATSGNIMITGSDHGTVKVWDLDTDRLLVARLRGHIGEARSVAISGNLMVTGSGDCTAKVWDNCQLLYTLKGHAKQVTSGVISDNKVITGSLDDTVKIWPLSPNLQGIPSWIMSKATTLQADFIKRAYEATVADQDLIIAMPTKLGVMQEGDSQAQQDGNVYFSFPAAVRAGLCNMLNIRK